MTHEHIIHLNNVVRIPNTRKANRAIFAIKQYAQKHTHATLNKIRVSNDVNELVWARGMNHKLNKLTVVFRKKDDQVFIFTPSGKDLKTFDKPVKETGAKKSGEKKDANAATTAKATKAKTMDTKSSEKTEKVVTENVAGKKDAQPAEKKDKAQ